MEVEKLPKIETKEGWFKKELQERLKQESPEFNQFLAEQVFLPPEKRDEKFNNYAAEEHIFWGFTMKDIAFSPGEQKEIGYKFKKYLKYLDLTENDLKGKRILDLGCGKEGNFVKTCIENGITADIFGLDSEIEPDKLDEKYKKHFLKADFEKEIPAGNYDYITAVAAVGLSPEIKKVISHSLKALKEAGEIRISPVYNVPGPEWEKIKFNEDSSMFSFSSKEGWQNILESLLKEEKIKYEFKPFGIRTFGIFRNYDGVVLKEVLIIKKKPKD